ncbi:hypothetical protein Bbelb_049940 [Branchiostoma belcheri]|nr:hypothetical protein Bbelb_049940 [Branchiostoma belcheri]
MKVKTAEGDERVVSPHRVMFLTSDLPSLTTSMHVSHLCNHKHLSYEERVINQQRRTVSLKDGNHSGYPNSVDINVGIGDGRCRGHGTYKDCIIQHEDGSSSSSTEPKHNLRSQPSTQVSVITKLQVDGSMFSYHDTHILAGHCIYRGGIDRSASTAEPSGTDWNPSTADPSGTDGSASTAVPSGIEFLT